MIEQTDVVLCEDGRTVMFMGHMQDPDDTVVMTFELPEGMEPADIGLSND